jgi:benzoate membrane transport protein
MAVGPQNRPKLVRRFGYGQCRLNPSVTNVASEPVKPPAAHRPTLGQILRDLGLVQITNGFIGFLFAATGPAAIILAIGSGGGLSHPQLASWIFGAFFVNGVISLLMTWAYRQPLCFFWTIPGTVLVGPALKHLSFAEVVGAYYATSLLILVLGATGLARRALQWLPMPIVMGMVAGVFLRFGLDVVRALHSDLMIAGPMLVVFLGLSALARLGRLLPPIIGALLVGVVMSIATTRLNPALVGSLAFADPQLAAPAFSLNAMIELVVPLMITILVVQNGQGIAVLTAAGHAPPVTAVSVACAVGGALSALVGAVGTCLTGPVNGIVTSSGDRERHYAAALVTAVLGIMFGLAAPTFTQLMLVAPMELIMMLGGLAMLRVLLSAFMTSFKGPFAFGALVSFLVTVADLAEFNIGAAFWGLVAGTAISWLLERSDFHLLG